MGELIKANVPNRHAAMYNTIKGLLQTQATLCRFIY